MQLLALQGEPALVGRLAELLDISPVAVDETIATGVGDGVFEVAQEAILLVDRRRAEQALRELSPSQRRDLSRRRLAMAAWADPRRSPFVRLRLALTAGDLAVDECLGTFLDEVGPERDTPLSFIEFLDEVEKGSAISQASPGLRAVFVARRALALRELGRLDEGRAVGDAAYRLAVRTGDSDVVSEVLQLSRYPSTESVTDDGAHFGALARVWRPSAATPQSAALVEGLLAYHELARGPVASGIARGRRALAMCAELDDPTLRSKIVPMLTYELLWDRSFVPEAEEFTSSCRVGDSISFTITVKNQGNVDSGPITVQDVIPAGLAFVSTSDGGLNNGQVVTWSLLNLVPGETHVFTLIVRMTDATKASYVNFAEIVTDGADQYDVPGIDVEDEDSVPDSDITNDPLVDTDDVNIDQIPGDEDDHDRALLDVAKVRSDNPRPGTIPGTGSNTAPLLWGAVVMMAFGALASVAARRRRQLTV